MSQTACTDAHDKTQAANWGYEMLNCRNISKYIVGASSHETALFSNFRYHQNGGGECSWRRSWATRIPSKKLSISCCCCCCCCANKTCNPWRAHPCISRGRRICPPRNVDEPRLTVPQKRRGWQVHCGNDWPLWRGQLHLQHEGHSPGRGDFIGFNGIELTEDISMIFKTFQVLVWGFPSRFWKACFIGVLFSFCSARLGSFRDVSNLWRGTALTEASLARPGSLV